MNGARFEFHFPFCFFHFFFGGLRREKTSRSHFIIAPNNNFSSLLLRHAKSKPGEVSSNVSGSCVRGAHTETEEKLTKEANEPKVEQSCFHHQFAFRVSLTQDLSRVGVRLWCVRSEKKL